MKVEYFRKYLKKYGNKLLIVLALVFLAAAFFRLTVHPAPETPDEPSITFTYWLDGGPEKETMESLIGEFEELHDGIKIILNAGYYEDLRRILFSQDETEDFPGDIIALDTLWVPELLSKEIIESATVPIISFINIFYYNIDLLREAGFSRPPKTRSEFLNYANSGGLALGLNSSRGIYDDVFPWIWSAGLQLIQNGKPALNSRTFIESLSFLASLNSDGFIAHDSFSADSEKKLDDFISGRAAFMIAPASCIALVRERMGDEAFGVSSIPTPDNYAGKTYFGTAGWAIGVSSASAQKEGARLFADFLTEKAPFLSEQIMAVPGNGIPPAQDNFYSKVWDIAIAGEAAQEFSGLPWTELERTFREELAAMFTEKSLPAETAATIQKKWEIILGH